MPNVLAIFGPLAEKNPGPSLNMCGGGQTKPFCVGVPLTLAKWGVPKKNKKLLQALSAKRLQHQGRSFFGQVYRMGSKWMTSKGYQLRLQKRTHICMYIYMYTYMYNLYIYICWYIYIYIYTCIYIYTYIYIYICMCVYVHMLVHLVDSLECGQRHPSLWPRQFPMCLQY